MRRLLPLAMAVSVSIGIGLGLLASALSGCTSQPVTTQALAAQGKTIVDQLKAQEESVFERIERHFSALRALQEKLLTSEVRDERLYDEVLSELRRITEEFEALVEDEGKIKRELLSREQSLKRLTQKARERLAELKARKFELERELASFHHPDPELVEDRRRGLTQAIKYVQKQIEHWERFLTTQEGIEDAAGVIEQHVERFLIIAETNALVYREALNLLELERDIREAARLLAEVPELERLAQEMVAHWEVLDNLVEELLSIGQ